VEDAAETGADVAFEPATGDGLSDPARRTDSR